MDAHPSITAKPNTNGVDVLRRIGEAMLGFVSVALLAFSIALALYVIPAILFDVKSSFGLGHGLIVAPSIGFVSGLVAIAPFFRMNSGARAAKLGALFITGSLLLYITLTVID